MNPVSVSSSVGIEEFNNIIKHGTYYFPAERHYYAGCVVRCDRCNRTNLKSSIGYHEMDLCLACASQVESLMARVNPPTIIHTPTPITDPYPSISGPVRVPISSSATRPTARLVSNNNAHFFSREVAQSQMPQAYTDETWSDDNGEWEEDGDKML